MYPHQAESHEMLHTGKNKICCEYRGCRKKFTSKKSMKQHLQEHFNRQHNITWNCDDCPADESNVFFTLSNYNQHRRGLHGPGYVARCSKKCKWPSERKKHQMECEECKRILRERNSKPKYPHIKKFRKRFPKPESSSESEKENETDSEKENQTDSEPKRGENVENSDIKGENDASNSKA